MSAPCTGTGTPSRLAKNPTRRKGRKPIASAARDAEATEGPRTPEETPAGAVTAVAETNLRADKITPPDPEMLRRALMLRESCAVLSCLIRECRGAGAANLQAHSAS